MDKRDRLIFSTLFFAIFATVTGVGIVVPLLPVYAHDLGASGLYIGLIFGAFSLSRTFFLPYFGMLSDRKGRKIFIIPGLLAYTLISFTFLFSNSVQALIVIRFIQGIASAMLMPVIQAYVGDITPEGKEGWTMGLFNMSLFFGLSIGPVLGGIINDMFSLNAAFIAMGLLSFISFLLAQFLLPPTQSEKVVRRGKAPEVWRLLLKDRDIAGLFIFRFVYTACIGIIWGFLPVLADLELSLSSSLIGTLVMLGILVSGMIHLPMGYLADRLNKKMMVFIGGLIAGYAVLSFFWSSHFWDMVSASIIFGIGGGIAMPALMAMAVIKGNRIGAMGSVMAFLTVGHSLGMLAGSLLAGLMMDMVRLRYAFPMGAFLMILGTCIFLMCTGTNKDSSFDTKQNVPATKYP